MKPILTDICWTLYRSNTTFDFLDATIEDDGYKRLRRWSKNPIVRRLNILLLRLTHRDFIRERALRYLRKYSENEIEQRAEQFVHEVLSQRKIEEAWNVIKGREVMLVSGTIEPIAKAVAKETGAIAVYAGDIFKQQAQEQYEHYDIITDNLSDITMMKKADEIVIVTYGNRDKWEHQLKDKKVRYIDCTTGRY